MAIVYVPPPIVYQSEETRVAYGNPYFFECNGKIINLSAAKEFCVDHIPMTSYYWPSVKIGSTSYHLSSAVDSEEKAMEFLRTLTNNVQSANNATTCGQANSSNPVGNE